MASFGKGFVTAFRPQEIAQFLLAYQDKLEERRKREEELAQQREAQIQGGKAILEAAQLRADTMLNTGALTEQEYNQWIELLKGQAGQIDASSAAGVANLFEQTYRMKKEYAEQQQKQAEKLNADLNNVFTDIEGNTFGIFTQRQPDGNLKVWTEQIKTADGKPVIIKRTKPDDTNAKKLEDLQKEYKSNVQRLWGLLNNPGGFVRGEVGKQNAIAYYSTTYSQYSILEQLGATQTVRKSDIYKQAYNEILQQAQANNNSLTISKANEIIRKYTVGMQPEQATSVASVIITDLLKKGYKLEESEF